MALSEEEQKRRTLVDELSDLEDQARGLRDALNKFVERHQIYQDARFSTPVNTAYKLAREIKAANDDLKRAGEQIVRNDAMSWHRWRFDDPDTANNPTIESVTFKGDVNWEVIMSSPEYGRERVVIETDTIGWMQVYSADKID